MTVSRKPGPIDFKKTFGFTEKEHFARQAHASSIFNNMATRTAPRNALRTAAAKPAPVAAKPAAPKPAEPKHYGTSDLPVAARMAEIKSHSAGDHVRREMRAMLHPVCPTVHDVSLNVVSGERAWSVRNALDTRYGTQGGYATAQIDLSELFAAVRVGASPFRSAGCTVLTETASVASLIPQVDIGNTAAVVVAQGAAPNTQDMTFSARRVPFFKLGYGPTLVPYELLRDSPIVDNLITIAHAIALARGEGSTLTLSSGTRQGIVDVVPVGVTAASSIAIAEDELYSLIGGVETEYAEAPANGFMMHRLVYTALRKQKDGDGGYLYRGPWGTLLGKKVNFNRWMTSTITTGTKPVLFGDWSQFAIVDVNQTRLSRFRDAAGVIENDLTAIQSFAELDAALLAPSASYPPIVSLLMP